MKTDRYCWHLWVCKNMWIDTVFSVLQNVWVLVFVCGTIRSSSFWQLLNCVKVSQAWETWHRYTGGSSRRRPDSLTTQLWSDRHLWFLVPQEGVEEEETNEDEEEGIWQSEVAEEDVNREEAKIRRVKILNKWEGSGEWSLVAPISSS